MRGRPALRAAASSRFPSELVESLSNRAAARCAALVPCPAPWPVVDRCQEAAAWVFPQSEGCLQPSVGQALGAGLYGRKTQPPLEAEPLGG